MRIPFLSAAFVVMSVMCACNSNENKQDNDEVTTTDSLSEKTGNELSENTITILDNSPIYSFAKAKSTGFDWKSFQLTKFWKEDSMFTRPFQPEKNFFENYGAFLRYSPDSSKFIDLDSYNLEIEKNSKGQYVASAQGPDTEVSLVDLNKGQKIRLVFLGPGSMVEDARWIDNENLIIIGAEEETDKAEPTASIYTFNIPSRRFEVYQSSDSAVTENLKGYWKKERLKSVLIK